MENIKKNLNLIIFGVSLILSTNLWAGSSSKCEVIAEWSSMITVYCPKSSTPHEILDYLVSVKGNYMGKVIDFTTKDMVRKLIKPRSIGLFHVFSDKSKTPKNKKSFDRMSDKEFDRIKTAQLDINENNGYKQFYCKKAPKNQLTDCSELLR